MIPDLSIKENSLMIGSRKLELIGGLFFLAFGLTIYWLAQQLEVPAEAGWMTDTAVWPKWVGILMMALSAAMMIQAQKLPLRQIAFIPKKRTWVLLASLAAYNLFLPLLGYFLGAILWMVVLGLAAEERSFFKLFSFGIIATLLGYLIFWKILMVPLPVGRLEIMLGLDNFVYR